MDDFLRIASFAGTGSAAAIALLCAAKAAAVLMVAGVMAFALNRRGAATRHLVWAVGLAGALAVLPLSLALPSWGLPVLSSAGRSSASTRTLAEPTTLGQTISPDEPIRDFAITPTVRTISLPKPPNSRIEIVAARKSTRFDSSILVLVIWGTGTALMLARSAVGWAILRGMNKNAKVITERLWSDDCDESAGRLGLRAGVTLLRGGPAVMPMTWGVLRPVLLLPVEADEWPADRRRAVLLHELAHVKRRDCLTQWLGVAACAVYWFNPLAWWAASRLRSEREQAADDLVLAAGELPSVYAAQLLGVARSLRPALILASAAMAMARPSGLERRLLSILDVGRDRNRPARPLAALCLVVMLGTSATLAAVQLIPGTKRPESMAGQVLGPDGKPSSRASVVLFVSRRHRPLPTGFPWKAEVVGRATSDGDGRFRIELNDVESTDDDNITLVATSPSRGFASVKIGDIFTPLVEPLRLAPEQPMNVRLVDLQGSPLSGAKVSLTYTYPRKGGEHLGKESLITEVLPTITAAWTADADGRLVLNGIGPDQSMSLDVTAPGFGTQPLRIETKVGVSEITHPVQRAHVVEGRVTLGDKGPPAIGATVRTQSMSERGGTGLPLGGGEMKTDADGRYRIECAQAAAIVVDVYPPEVGDGGFLYKGRLLNPEDSISSRVDIALPRGVLVKGRITDATTGQPVAGAVVTHQAHDRNNPYFIEDARPRMSGDEIKGVTGEDGRFRLAVIPGPGYLLVKGPNHNYLHEMISNVDLYGHLVWPNARHYPDALKKISPKPEEGPIEVALTLRPGKTVKGRVVGPEGEPDTDTVLFTRWYLGMNEMTINYGQNVMPARGGRFELAGCDTETSAPVYFLDSKKQRGAVVELSGKQADEDLTVKLEPCGSATVRFIDEQGKPLRSKQTSGSLEIVLTPGAAFGEDYGGMQSPLMSDHIMVQNLDRERYRGLKNDAEGRVTFPTLIPGATYRIQVLNQPAKTVIEFTVKPGEAKNLGDLTIRNPNGAG